VSDTLKRLYSEQGQSPWLDNIQRSHIESGRLGQMRDRGVRGLTSNPSIFQKAIQGSQDYDAQFLELISSGHSIEESYWQMVLRDINDALSVFTPIYETSSKADGYVSVEVDPRLAHDTAGTIDAARWLRKQIPHPNVMIKIPATVAGLPAITQMVSEGVNVNVTLIFSLPRYADVMDAYLTGLERRVDQGAKDLSEIASVASFFISRVDSEIDPHLESADAQSLLGKAAINQGVLAYEAFRETFSGTRWDKLSSLGAQLQRPLWASTSTKNPSYPDTLYVDSLIGPNSVNTLPESTLEAFADHGTIARTIDSKIEQARTEWQALAEHGIDVAVVAEKLEREGVAAFIKSFDELLDALSTKADTLRA
jgi:transaldolase